MSDIDIFKDKEKPTYSSYVEEYAAFLDKFQVQEVAAAEVGELIARMSQHFTKHNLILSRALKLYSSASKEAHQGFDASGKPISAAKADVIAAATDEAAAYQEAKVHVQNIEQNINALKALQKGLLFEYANV